MIARPNPTSPPPVIVPSSLWVKPNCWPQSFRIAPRTENPIPAAIRVAKLAQNRIFSFNPGDDEPAVRASEPPMMNSVGEGNGDRLVQGYYPRSSIGVQQKQRAGTGLSPAGTPAGSHNWTRLDSPIPGRKTEQ